MNTSTYHSVQDAFIYQRAQITTSLTKRPEPAAEGINHEAFYEMAEGRFPDLREFCLTLAGIMHGARAPESAKDLVPVLNALPELDEKAIEGFIKSPVTRHVLISGERFEVVLHHWKPGKANDIHGHPSGGCLFKLLRGKVEEVRYTPQTSPKLLGFASYRTGDLGYIDNKMAYHQVGNPYGRPAVSIHVYLKKSI